MVKKFLDHTTPSARANVASRLFLIAQPPLLLLRRGVRLEPVPRLGLRSNLIRNSASLNLIWLLSALRTVLYITPIEGRAPETG